MSDYSSTYTEGTGDTIDTTDFSIEFDAIAAASATKYDSGDLLDEDDMASDSATKFASQQSIKAFVDAVTLTMLDDWELLDSHTQENTWRDSTANFSEGSTTLSTAGATAAIIQVASAGGLDLTTVYARKGGTAYSGNSTKVAVGTTGATCTQFHVSLDAGSDFEYQVETVGSLTTCTCHLVGYYG